MKQIDRQIRISTLSIIASIYGVGAIVSDATEIKFAFWLCAIVLLIIMMAPDNDKEN